MKLEIGSNRIVTSFSRKQNEDNIDCYYYFKSKDGKAERFNIVMNNNKVYLLNNNFREKIPICVVYKFLDISSDQEIMQMIGEKYQLEFASSLMECVNLNIFTQCQAASFLQKMSRLSNPIHYTMDKILCHPIFEKVTNKQKAFFLSLMIHRLFDAIYNKDKSLHRYKMTNMRIFTPADFLTLLFENKFIQYKNRVCIEVSKLLTDKKTSIALGVIKKAICNKVIIGSSMEYSIKTGIWPISYFKAHRLCVSNILSRECYLSSLSMVNKVISHSILQYKSKEAREMHASYYGLFCPNETPDGNKCDSYYILLCLLGSLGKLIMNLL